MVKYDYDYSKLRGLIREKIGTEYEYAKKINRSVGYVSQVLNGNNQFSQKDIENSVNVLDIADSDIGTYFFTIKVHKNETDEVLA